MGTTLTGTTPQDTYDSLIKVTDNGPLSGSLKTLTDGLGNDSALALSTSAASVTGTLAVSSGLTAVTGSFLGSSANGTLRAEIAVEGVASNNVALIAKTSNGGNDLFRWFDGATQLGVFKNSGNVGIGTSAPTEQLHIVGADNKLLIESSNFAALRLKSGTTRTFNIQSINTDSGALRIYDVTADAERLRITSTGVLSLTQGQIKFPAEQVASADVNTLDDYEEGTFTYSITFGGGSTGITYNHRTGTYTKIGNKVTINGLISLSNKGSDTGDARITGLPFTIPNAVANYTAPSFQLFNITFANQVFGYAVINTTQISINEMTEAGVVTTLTNADFANNSEVIIGLTYFV